MSSPCLESSPTPSHSPKPCMRKITFQNKTCCFPKHTTEVSIKYGTTLLGECVGEPFEQSWPSSEMICWTVSQPHSPEIHPVKFLSKTFSFFFQFFMSCTTPKFLGYPDAYEMQYAISIQFIYQYISNMHIYSQIYNYIT